MESNTMAKGIFVVQANRRSDWRVPNHMIYWNTNVREGIYRRSKRRFQCDGDSQISGKETK